MKSMLSIRELNVGIPLTEEEMRKKMGGNADDRDGGVLPGVTIYSGGTGPWINPNDWYGNSYTNQNPYSYTPSDPNYHNPNAPWKPPIVTVNPDGSCVISDLPTLNDNFGQVGPSTCTVGAMEFVEKFFKGKRSFDDLLTIEAQSEISQGMVPAGTTEAAAKYMLTMNGFNGTTDQFNNMLDKAFLVNDVNGFKNATEELNHNHPVMAYITSSVQNGVVNAHEIVIVGYDSDKQTYKYFDPMDNKSYEHYIEANKVSNTRSIGALK